MVGFFFDLQAKITEILNTSAKPGYRATHMGDDEFYRLVTDSLTDCEFLSRYFGAELILALSNDSLIS